MKVAAIIVAAGRGSRAGAGLPKQYRPVRGEPLIRHALRLLAMHPAIGQVIVAIHPDDRPLFDAAAQGLPGIRAVVGGATRQASGLAGLEALAPSPPDLVLIHDAARPFTSPDLVTRVIEGVRITGAAIPGLAVTDTIKRVDSHGVILETPERATLRAVQTPQAFSYQQLLAVHRKAAAAGLDSFTDDAAVWEWAGGRVLVVAGEAGNIKMTMPEDFTAMPSPLAALGDIRIGNGFDVHAFTEGDHVTLGGLRIAHSQALSGHSDADVVLHALTDAILGAIAEGDIGSHFPPSEARWKGANSALFLRHAMELVALRGGMVAHLDITIIAEAPKIGPHRDAIRASIATICAMTTDRVAVKATTTEKLGFTGRREGIAALANATVRLPWPEA